MPLRPGDRYTVSMNPTIEVAKFTMLKPFASITREVKSDDDIAETVQDVRELVHRVALHELVMVVGVLNALGPKLDMEAAQAYLRQEIDHGSPQVQREAPPPAQAGPRPARGPVRRPQG